MCLAVPGKLLKLTSTEPLQRTGDIQFGCVIKNVNLTLVPSAVEGDYVLVHAGLGISVIDEAEAEKVIDYLSQIAESETTGAYSQ